jgi:hypothetical protein
VSSIISAQLARHWITLANGNVGRRGPASNLVANPMPGSVFSRLNNYFNVNLYPPDDYTFGSAPRYLPTGAALINGRHPDEELRHPRKEIDSGAAGSSYSSRFTAVGHPFNTSLAAPPSAKPRGATGRPVAPSSTTTAGLPTGGSSAALGWRIWEGGFERRLWFEARVSRKLDEGLRLARFAGRAGVRKRSSPSFF